MDKLKAALLSIIVNVTLTIAKVGVGILTNSLGVIAEALHSFFDLLASVFAYLGIRKAQEAADLTHPYGHEKFENLSSLVQTILILLTALWVGWEAIGRLQAPQLLSSTALGLGMMLAALVIDYFFSKFLHDVSRREGSAALEADAYHFTSDMWSTTAVIIGLVAANLGFPQVDALAALLVAAMMARLSYRLGMKSINVLLDKGASIAEVEGIVKIVSSTKGIKGYHKLRTRHAGSRLAVDLHIQVDGSMPLEKAHRLSHKLKGRLTSQMPAVKDVLIHIEPFEGEGKK